MRNLIPNCFQTLQEAMLLNGTKRYEKLKKLISAHIMSRDFLKSNLVYRSQQKQIEKISLPEVLNVKEKEN